MKLAAYKTKGPSPSSFFPYTKLDAVTFASPSAAKYWTAAQWKGAADDSLFNLPVYAIGQTTRKAAKKLGFKKVIAPDLGSNTESMTAIDIMARSIANTIQGI